MFCRVVLNFFLQAWNSGFLFVQLNDIKGQTPCKNKFTSNHCQACPHGLAHWCRWNMCWFLPEVDKPSEHWVGFSIYVYLNILIIIAMLLFRGGFAVNPCEKLFWVVLVLKRTGCWPQQVFFITISSQNKHYSKEIYPWCYCKPHLIILQPCKVSNPIELLYC